MVMIDIAEGGGGGGGGAGVVQGERRCMGWPAPWTEECGGEPDDGSERWDCAVRAGRGNRERKRRKTEREGRAPVGLEGASRIRRTLTSVLSGRSAAASRSRGQQR